MDTVFELSSLKFKLGLSTVIVCLLIVLAVSFVELYQLRGAERDRILAEFATFEKGARETISEAVWRYDWDMVETIVENQTSKVLSFVEICDNEVARCLQHGRRDLSPFLEQRTVMTYDDAINGEEVVIGTIYLQGHYSTLASHIRAALPRLLLTNTLGVFAIATVLLFLFHRQVVQRLLALENYTRRIDLQQIDTLESPVRSRDDERRDEIDRLADAMDSLVARIKDELERRKGLEQQLVQAQKMEALGTLAGGIAHDFNNILAAILGFAELSMRRTEPGSEVHRSLEKIVHAGQRARNLTSQILVFSRRCETLREVVALAEVVEETLNLVRVSLPRGIEVAAELDGGLYIQGDSDGLHQVVMNVVTNGVQAMAAAGGRLRVTLRETVLEGLRAERQGLPAGRYGCLTICDDGPGIPPAAQMRIFEPFFTTKRAGEGTGMGLAVVHGIVQNHGGAITVESGEGEGTCFTIHLPLTEQEPARSADRGSIPRGAGQSIVLVDDEAEVLAMGRAMLEHLGYTVRAFSDPLAAWACLRDEGAADLLITDLTMPQMNGLELARAARGCHPGMPVLLWTGHRDEMASAGLDRKLVDTILQKPFDITRLAQTVNRLLTAGRLTGIAE